ncbi:hypothetical protein [Jeotgalibacillus malaysiensis]|uniref:hypothetical protein n=1 Tax=Jeotgalibacillus malaysiensis TaxID=1508404 RepID=UPI00384C4C74
MMMKIEQFGNVLVTDVLDVKVMLRASQSGIETTVMKGNDVVSIKETPAWRDELLEKAHEEILSAILNEVFADMDEVDDLLEALEGELSEYLQRLAQDGAGSNKQLH